MAGAGKGGLEKLLANPGKEEQSNPCWFWALKHEGNGRSAGEQIMKNTILVMALVVALAPTGIARAQSYVYNWTYSSPLYTGSGMVSVDPTMPVNGLDGLDSYIPVISGTFNGQAITGLDISGNYDNYFLFQASGSYVLTSPTEPLNEVYEFAFLTTADEYVMNNNGNDPGTGTANEFETYDLNNGGSGIYGSDDAYDFVGNFNPVGDFIITPVPEPGAKALFLGGAILFIGLRFRHLLRAARA